MWIRKYLTVCNLQIDLSMPLTNQWRYKLVQIWVTASAGAICFPPRRYGSLFDTTPQWQCIFSLRAEQAPAVILWSAVPPLTEMCCGTLIAFSTLRWLLLPVAQYLLNHDY